MPLQGIWSFLRRFLHNQSSATLLFNPYESTTRTEDGKLKRKRPKIAYLQILYDLFIVAALQIFSREAALVTGDQIASLIAFFTILWSIWASQAIFDLHYRSGHDMLSMLFVLIQLSLFGAMAAIGAGFNIATGIKHFKDDLPAGIFEWLQPYKAELIDHDDRKRALQTASAMYAISRVVLACQYAIVTLQAKRASCPVRPTLYIIGGLFASCACWIAAFCCDLHSGPRWAIARLSLWILGVIFEYGVSLWVMRAESHFESDDQFFLERFNALTIIIIGEGVFGLFESFSSVIQGPQSTPSVTSIGVLFASICMYLSTYYLYFGHKVDTFRIMRGSTLIWGILHYPLHLCLLLVFQAVNYNVEAVAVLEALEGLIDTGGSAVGELAAFYFASSNVTVDQLLELTLTSTNGTYLNAFAHNLGVNRTAALELGAYMANGNTTKFFQWTGANTAQLYTRLFAIARFPPTAEIYILFDQLGEYGFDLPEDWSDVYFEGIVSLYRLMYGASLFGFAVLGGYLIILSAINWLQALPMTKYIRISIASKAIIGIVMVGLVALNIGGFNVDLDDELSESLMASLVYSYWLVPSMLSAVVTVLIVDTILFLWKHADMDIKHLTEDRGVTEGEQDEKSAHPVITSGDVALNPLLRRTITESLRHSDV